MALLHYQNLTLHRPDILMARALYGLKSHHDYLERIKKYLESDDSVLRLSVRKGYKPSTHKDEKTKTAAKDDGPIWVELTESEDLIEVSDRTIEAFLDNEVKAVFETGIDVSNESPSDKDNRKHSARKFTKSREIKVLDRDSKTEQLLLERMPVGDILLRPNTYTIRKQLEAIKRLQDAPSMSHLPLLRLLENSDHAKWQEMPKEFDEQYFHPEFDAEEGQEMLFPDEEGISAALEWKVLTDTSRPGTTEQRLFVGTALNTPDFAILEGPPGSGKTTAICELIIQLVLQNKRVLLCASTHVAVDNVIERLMDKENQHRNLITPLRIGKGESVSEQVQQWTLSRFIKTESNRIKSYLNQLTRRTESQELLKQNIQNDPSIIERIVLDSANLVCGTTIGLLQHPDIKSGKSSENGNFDVMIIDEASKTTFQEFLVPALYAKRWILVGDPKQLSPYIDDEELAVNIAPCLPNPMFRNACVDVFLAKQHSDKKRRIAVVQIEEGSPNQDAAFYEEQASKHGILLKRAQPDYSLAYASIVIGSLENLKLSEDYLPLDASTFRLDNDKLTLPKAVRRAAAFANRSKLKTDSIPSWESEIAWRQARLYEQRFAKESLTENVSNSTTNKLKADLNSLMPNENFSGINLQKVENDLALVRRVALPSVLECLRFGFERSDHDRKGSALTDGLPEDTLNERRVQLSYQHRMHPEIAQFSHDHIYDGKALFSPDNMTTKRHWEYHYYASRFIWLDVKGKLDKRNANEAEANEIIKRLQHFDSWASRNPNQGKPWEVAILCFYRGQEFELQQRLKKWTGSRSKRYFERGEKNTPYLSIQLCTVDRFQGHEADLVFLSFSNDHVTSFLESPNRLNVALTRAKYQLVIVGNRQKFKESKSLVGKLANLNKWSLNLEDK